MPGKRYDFGIPKELSQSAAKMYTLAIEGDQFLIEFHDQEAKPVKVRSHISGEKGNDLENVKDAVHSKLTCYFDDSISGQLTNKLVDVIDRVYDTNAIHVIQNIKRKHRADEAKLGPLDGNGNGNGHGDHQKDKEQKPVFVVKKFSAVTTTSPNGLGLAEATLINGKPVFAVTINGGRSVTFFEELETADMVLHPPGKQEYPPNSAYEYENEDEFMEHIQFALERDSLYNLYEDVKKFYTKEYFVDTDPKNSTLLALFTITSYFQDKFSTVPYIWLIGDNGSGKNSILITYSKLGYRVFYMTGASGANICEYFGTVEEGQGSLAEDELGDLDYDEYKRLLYMTGYASGGCVPKILDGNTKGRDQRFYRSYGQKMSASESLPSVKYSKGVLDREFIVKCVKGFPKYNVKILNKKTKTPEVLRLQHELDVVKKRLFAYRLTHFDNVIPEIQGLNISGRALELTESALLLFHKHTSSPEENKIFNDDILPTLSSFLNDRLSRRNDSLEGRLYPIIRAMVEAQSSDEFDNDTIFHTVMSEMGGTEIPGKTNIFAVDDLGMTVTRTKIIKILRDKFKAINTRIILPDGSRQRGLKISSEVLDRIKASYEDPWDIRIISPEDTSAQVNQLNQVLGQYGGQNDGSTPKQEVEHHEEPERENTPDQPQNERKEAFDSIKNNNDPISKIPGLGGQSNSIEESVDEAGVSRVLQIAMLGNEGNSLGYFDKAAWMTTVMTLPKQDPYYCDQDQAEQMLQALIDDHTIEEFEPGKYRPTEKLSESGGDTS